MQIEFEGQVALVTGASSGIGHALAQGLASSGARVAIHYRSGKAAAAALRDTIIDDGGDAAVFQMDLADRGAGSQLIDDVVERFGRLDILINNAGAVLTRSPIASATDQLYDEVMATNFRSAFETCRAAVPTMVSQEHGSIVNVSSISARTGGGGGSILYSAAKAALATFTRGLARELAPHGIRVNAISPGYIDTPFHEGRTSPEVLETLITQIPLGRAGTPRDCVGPALFLAADPLSSFVTGQVVEVNGGQISP